MTNRFMLAIVAGALLAAGFSGSALAGDSFGQHVATCAQMDLGQRPAPPTVTCTHDGVTMTFANFGEMAQHMRGI